METHVKACGNELLNTPSEAVNQQLEFCIDTDTHTHSYTHSACKWMGGRRCDARYHSHNGTWVSWKMLVRFFDGVLFFSARDRRVKRFPSPAPPPFRLQLQLQLQLQLGTAFVYTTYAIDLGYFYITCTFGFNSKHFRIFIFQPNLPDAASAAAAAFYWTQSSRIFIDDAMTTPILWARPKINHKSPVLSPK